MSLTLLLACATLLAPSDARIGDLLVVGDTVLASTQEGIYKGSRKAKTWRKVTYPGTSRLPLEFADGNPGKGTIYGFVPKGGWDQKSQKVIFDKPALYASKDGGDTWELRNDTEEFWHLLVMGKKLYCVVHDDHNGGSASNGFVKVSEDGGRTWSHLTQPASRARRVFPDPDHPGLICLQVVGWRGYIFQAQDDSYKWKEYREGDWPSRGKASFLREKPLYSINLGTGYMQFATLGNYFDYEFGTRAALPGVRVYPGKQSYRFDRTGRKDVEVKVRFLSEVGLVDILDNPDTNHFWGLHVRTPSGREGYLYPSQTELSAEDRPSEYRAANKLTRKSLKFGEGYTRKLDLETFGGFYETGAYRVKVIYRSGWITPKKQWDVEKDHEFYGTTASAAFTVEIEK